MNTSNTDTLPTPEFAAYVGLDWGDKNHALAWTAGASKTAPQTGTLVNSPEGTARLAAGVGPAL